MPCWPGSMYLPACPNCFSCVPVSGAVFLCVQYITYDYADSSCQVRAIQPLVYSG